MKARVLAMPLSWDLRATSQNVQIIVRHQMVVAITSAIDASVKRVSLAQIADKLQVSVTGRRLTRQEILPRLERRRMDPQYTETLCS